LLGLARPTQRIYGFMGVQICSLGLTIATTPSNFLFLLFENGLDSTFQIKY
jgi:hypothetical protein